MSTKEMFRLTPGADCFTAFDLLKKAATHKGLMFRHSTHIDIDRREGYSEPIKKYTLNPALLTYLDQRGIKRHPRPAPNNDIFTLVDENPQEEVPGWLPSNYWNFELLDGNHYKFDLRVVMNFRLIVSVEKRGVLLLPRIQGTFLSAGDFLPNFRMLKALVEYDKQAPALARELVEDGGQSVVSWTDLGLGGICEISSLFKEFAGLRKSVQQLAYRVQVFDPEPYDQCRMRDNRWFITEPAQPKLMDVWRTQLEAYRNDLAA